jgi:branched-chain amino acid transport system permease protein
MVVGFVSPESFGVIVSIEFLTGAVVGGLATVFGPILGSLFTYFIPDFASDLNPAAPNVLYGVVLILVVIVMPTGIVGMIRTLVNLVVDRSPRPADTGVAPPPTEASTVPPSAASSAPHTDATRETPR